MSLIGQKKVFVGSNASLEKYKNFMVISSTFSKFKINCNIPVRVINKNQFVGFYPLIKPKKNKKLKSLWGSLRTLFFTLSYGAANNFHFLFKLVGVGFKMFKKNEKIILRLGLSHQIFLKLPFSKFQIKKIQKRPLIFKFSGPDYDLLKSIIFFLKSFKKVEPYKGKGFSFNKELIRLKEGKKLKN
jgi:large subunit ribosomal protein L6